MRPWIETWTEEQDDNGQNAREWSNEIQKPHFSINEQTMRVFIQHEFLLGSLRPEPEQLERQRSLRPLVS